MPWEIPIIGPLNRKIQNLNYEIGKLKISVGDGQDENKYSWNRFESYDAWITAIHNACAGKEKFGLSILEMMYKRAGFVSGTIEINLTDEKKEREKAFVEEFFKYNRINEAGLIDLLANIEKEAKILEYLRKDEAYEWEWTDSSDKKYKEKGMISTQYLSYKKYHYEVTPEPMNEDRAASFTYKRDGENIPAIDATQFVYRRYRGEPNDINSAMSLFQACYEHVIALEKAYFDMRTNNHLFAAPKPIVECPTAQEANETNKLLDDRGLGINLKTRQLLTLVGKFQYAVPAHSPSLAEEIKEHIEAISRITGIPAQHLGRADAVKNKNVVADMAEGLAASMYMDRMSCTEWMQELVEKSMEMMNGTFTALDPTAVEIKIGKITAAEWKRLIEFYMPARESEMISLTTFLENIPGLNVGAELERLKEEQEEKDQKAKDNQEVLFNNALDGDRAERIEEKNDETQERTGQRGIDPRSRPGG